ncbi:MAG: hypothetical protein WAL67_06245 [Candidatus Cybelea sp.]
MIFAVAFAGAIFASGAGDSQARPQATTTPRIAELGIALPAIGGRQGPRYFKKYFSPAVMQDIRDNLHATYVRTGWRPDGLAFESQRWRREDRELDAICSAGLHAMIIVPSPRDDKNGNEDLIANVAEFFSRYTQREPGCVRYAEIANEADLRANGFSDVKEYAAFYLRVAPIVARLGVRVLTSGTSGSDLPWTETLASILRGADPSAPVGGFGFHPYGVVPALMPHEMSVMRAAVGVAADGSIPEVYVTEIGQKRAADLYQTIVNLAPSTPTITIYEYMAQPEENPEYGLKNNPELYQAVQRAWATITASASPAGPFP